LVIGIGIGIGISDCLDLVVGPYDGINWKLEALIILFDHIFYIYMKTSAPITT